MCVEREEEKSVCVASPFKPPAGYIHVFREREREREREKERERERARESARGRASERASERERERERERDTNSIKNRATHAGGV